MSNIFLTLVLFPVFVAQILGVLGIVGAVALSATRRDSAKQKEELSKKERQKLEVGTLFYSLGGVGVG